MDLVDDVDLPLSRRRKGGPRNKVAHGLDAVVGGSIELMDVERGSTGDVEAGIATATRLALFRTRTVQRLREYASRRGLAGPSRAREEICVSNALVPNGVAQAGHHVRLTADLRKALGPVPPVERLELVGHDN